MINFVVVLTCLYVDGYLCWYRPGNRGLALETMTYEISFARRPACDWPQHDANEAMLMTSELIFNRLYIHRKGLRDPLLKKEEFDKLIDTAGKWYAQEIGAQAKLMAEQCTIDYGKDKARQIMPRIDDAARVTFADAAFLDLSYGIDDLRLKNNGKTGTINKVRKTRKLPAPRTDVSMEEFNMIIVGMTLEEVLSVAGPCDEILSSIESANGLIETLQWKNKKGGFLHVTFEGKSKGIDSLKNRVTRKMQVGLDY